MWMPFSRMCVSSVTMSMLEINLIAQDTTTYGADREERDGLALFEHSRGRARDSLDPRVVCLPGVHHARLIAVMRDIPRCCPISTFRYSMRILACCGACAVPRIWTRFAGRLRLAFCDARRGLAHDAHRRLSGRPSPSFARWSTLSVVRFDRLGFSYSLESGTAAEALGDDVPAEVESPLRRDHDAAAGYLLAA